MPQLNHEVAFHCLPVNEHADQNMGNTTFGLNLNSVLSPEEADIDSGLDGSELMAAYLVHEPHMEAIMRLLLGMSDEQRRISLGMMECLKMIGMR